MWGLRKTVCTEGNDAEFRTSRKRLRGLTGRGRVEVVQRGSRVCEWKLWDAEHCEYGEKRWRGGVWEGGGGDEGDGCGGVMGCEVCSVRNGGVG